MSFDKYRPHLWLIPEDRANSQLANGFVLHDSVDSRRMTIDREADGWPKALSFLAERGVRMAQQYPKLYILMLIDFDNIVDRRILFEEKIPDGLKPRVFVIGSRIEAEDLKREFGMSLEQIGMRIAQECSEDRPDLCKHPLLDHNREELERMKAVVRPFLFPEF
jgi:hypothetical protein